MGTVDPRRRLQTSISRNPTTYFRRKRYFVAKDAIENVAFQKAQTGFYSYLCSLMISKEWEIQVGDKSKALEQVSRQNTLQK